MEYFALGHTESTSKYLESPVNAVEVPKEQVGIVIAMDGISLPSGFIVAPAPTADHKHFQTGQTFINSDGHRGPQLETLQPGEYYINKLLFEVGLSPVAVVPPGYVAVIVSASARNFHPQDQLLIYQKNRISLNPSTKQSSLF